MMVFFPLYRNLWAGGNGYGLGVFLSFLTVEFGRTLHLCYFGGPDGEFSKLYLVRCLDIEIPNRHSNDLKFVVM